MAYCTGATKATITISIDGQVIEKIISNSLPVNITLQHGQTAQIQGSGLNSSDCNPLPNYGIYEYNGFVALVSAAVGSCSGLKPSLNDVTTSGTGDVYHSSAKIIRQYSSDWVLNVVDATGRIITKKYSTQPTYTVACDDGCPEGFCKCIIPEYPGYCCLDCDTTAASIRAITNELRGKNG